MIDPRAALFAELTLSWSKLDSFLAEAGPLSMRLGYSPEVSLQSDLERAFDTEIEPSAFDLAIIHDIHRIIVAADSEDIYDSLFLSRQAAILTNTDDCREVDKVLLRRGDAEEPFHAFDGGESITDHALAVLRRMSAEVRLMDDHDAVDVFFHDAEQKISHPLGYCGSFIVPEEELKGCPLKSQLRLEPDEEHASLVCDVHDHRGTLSITISRLARTLEGLHRVILFNSTLCPKTTVLP